MAGAITNGKDFNFFARINVTGAAFGTDAEAVFNFRGQQGFTLNNEGAGVVEYSFNGNTVHGDMTPGEGSENLKFDNRRVSRIWFRLKSGAASTIRVEAWARV